MRPAYDVPIAFGPAAVRSSPDCPTCGHPWSAHQELIGGIQGTRKHCWVCFDEKGRCA